MTRIIVALTLSALAGLLILPLARDAEPSPAAEPAARQCGRVLEPGQSGC